MSEEEKKAIDKLSGKQNETTWVDTIRQIKREEITDAVITRQKYITTILNLIDKQEKEIDEWQQAYIKENNYWLKFRNKINKIANNDKDCSDNEVIKAVQELKEKNASLQKEIKLMKSININDKYISKDKLKNKIEELENKIDGDDYWKYTTQQYVGMQYQVEILEELLED